MPCRLVRLFLFGNVLADQRTDVALLGWNRSEFFQNVFVGVVIKLEANTGGVGFCPFF